MFSRAARCITALCGVTLFTLAPAARAQPAPFTKTYANPVTTTDLSAAQMRIDLNGDGPLEFNRIRFIRTRKDGSFVVFNDGTNELRVFDANGQFVLSAGRKGSGPGEYNYFADVAAMRGDSLAILDGRLRRISVVGPTGAYARSISVNTPPSGLGSAFHVMQLPAGALVVGFSEVSQMQPQPQPLTFYERYFTVAANGDAFVPTGIRTLESDHFVQAMPTEFQMGNAAYWSLAFGRTGSVRTTGAGIVVGDGTAWSVQELSATGAVAGVHKLNRETDVVTNDDRTRYRTYHTRGARGKDSVVSELMVRDMPYPRTKPAYDRMEVEENGSSRLWLQSYPALGETQNTWIRLDPHTSTAVSVRMPARFRAMAFTATRVFGVWRDSDDVEHVRVFELPPPAR